MSLRFVSRLVASSLVAVAPLLTGLTGCSAEVDPPFRSFGGLELTGCKEAPGLVCGSFEVPQVHADPAGTKLRLHVTVARTPNAPPEPIVFLTGGPGQSVKDFSSTATYYARALGRDVILLEQRGNALAQPAIECGLPEQEEWKTTDELRSGVAACVAKYQSTSTHLGAFNTIESAHDIEDLRRLIERDRFVIWGGSYGTRLAGTFAREHPTSVRALVLDGATLGDRRYRRRLDPSLSFDRRLPIFSDWLLATCRADARCNREYPGGLSAEMEYRSAAGSLAERPLVLGSLTISSPAALESFAFKVFQFAPAGVLFVRALHAFNRGSLADFDARVRILGKTAGQYLAQAQSTGVSPTVNFTVNCNDRTRFLREDEIRARMEAQAYAPDAISEALVEARSAREICLALPPPTIDPTPFFAIPPRSDAPTLFLGGELDHVTPITWSHVDKAGFPRSQVVSYPCIAHTVAGSAGWTVAPIVDAFLRAGDDFESTTPLPRQWVEERCTAPNDIIELFLEDYLAQVAD